MIWGWNSTEWIRYYESWGYQENFDYRHGYIRGNTWKVIKDLRLLTSDGMDDWLCCSWRFLQCLEGDQTLLCLSKLRQFRRCESRTVYVCLCVMSRVRISIYWTGMWMSWCSSRCEWVPKIRDVYHGLLSLVDLYGTRSDHYLWTYMYSSLLYALIKSFPSN